MDCIKQHFEINETSIIDRHRCHMAAKFGVLVDEGHSKLPTLYRLLKLHKRPYKSKKGCKDQERYNQVPHLTHDTTL